MKPKFNFKKARKAYWDAPNTANIAAVAAHLLRPALFLVIAALAIIGAPHLIHLANPASAGLGGHLPLLGFAGLVHGRAWPKMREKAERDNLLIAHMMKREYKRVATFSMPFGQAHQARRRNPELPGYNDVIRQPFWDSFTVNVNTPFPSPTTLFSGPGTKTAAQTNMITNSQLPGGQRLIVYAIHFYVSNNTTLTDMQNIALNVTVQLNVGVKNYLFVPALFLTAGFGPITTAIAGIGSALPATTAVGFSNTYGNPDQANVFKLTRPVPIEQNETFNAVLIAQTGFSTQANSTNPVGTGCTVLVSLDGELYRQVA